MDLRQQEACLKEADGQVCWSKSKVEGWPLTHDASIPKAPTEVTVGVRRPACIRGHAIPHFCTSGTGWLCLSCHHFWLRSQCQHWGLPQLGALTISHLGL